jgi:hypothetical protein
VNDFEHEPVATYAGLVAGEPAYARRLDGPVRLAVETPYQYPGRGSLVVYLVSDGEKVRLSEGGQLLKYLESQGMDLSLDLVLSKTVFHAVRESPGVRMGSGQIYLDSTSADLSAELPRFVQTVLEVVGLRHSKYKEALVQLARASECMGQRAQPLATPF